MPWARPEDAVAVQDSVENQPAEGLALVYAEC
jgi:hypothetical protein